MTTQNKRPVLPPRGVFSPSAIVYDKTLAPTVRDTYTMLRGLAWGKSETPPISFAQLEDITGKSRTTIYGHMRELDTRGALRWRSAGDARLIVSFFDLDDLSDDQQIGEYENESGNSESGFPDLPDDDSLKESLNHHPLIESENPDKIRKSGQLVRKTGQTIRKSGLAADEPPKEPVQEPIRTVVDPAFGALVKLWQSIRGPITAFDADEIGALQDEWHKHLASLPEAHPNKTVTAQAAIEEALRATALQASRPNLKYARKVLLTFMAEGFKAESSIVPAAPAPVSEPEPAQSKPVETYAPMPAEAKRALDALLKSRREEAYATN
jgi:hypothetical protein